MDRRTQTLALLLVTLWASGCAAPFAKRGADEQPKSEQAAPGAETAQTAAVVDASLQAAKPPAAALADDVDDVAVDGAPSADVRTASDSESHASGVPGRTTAVVKHGGSGHESRDGAGDPAVDRQTLLDVIAEMEAAGVLDAEARGRLLDDLKQTDPALWPQLISYFKASLARAPRPGQAKPVARRATATNVDSADTVDEVFVSDSHESPRSIHRPTAPLAAEPAPEPVVLPAQTASAKTPAAASAKPAPGSDVDWRDHLAAAIAGLEQETAVPPGTSAAVGRHAALRLLYLADGRREDAIRPIAGVPSAQQDFWSKELFGLATYLDADRNSETSRRAAEAGVHLQGAAQRLAEFATLQVKNLSFCSEVSSFGVYKKFEQYEFQAGQEVLLYAEVENFRSEQTDKGFHTALKASYQILDSHGARVAEHEFKLTEEYCQNVRRDFFTNYFVWLPKRIYGGAYTLQLTLEDVKGQKIGQSSVDFTIKEKP